MVILHHLMSGPQHDIPGPKKRRTSEIYNDSVFFNVKKTETTLVEDVAPQNTQKISVSTTNDDDPVCSSIGAISLKVLPVLQDVDDLSLVLPFIDGTDGQPMFYREWLFCFRGSCFATTGTLVAVPCVIGQ